jgi:hypothetical protein
MTGEECLCSLLNLSKSEWHPLMISFLKGDDLDVSNDIRMKIEILVLNF